MTNAERIIKNVNAIMSMEEMPLTESDKIHIQKCIDEKIDFDDIINELIQNYMQKHDNIIYSKKCNYKK